MDHVGLHADRHPKEEDRARLFKSVWLGVTRHSKIWIISPEGPLNHLIDLIVFKRPKIKINWDTPTPHTPTPTPQIQICLGLAILWLVG